MLFCDCIAFPEGWEQQDTNVKLCLRNVNVNDEEFTKIAGLLFRVCLIQRSRQLRGYRIMSYERNTQLSQRACMKTTYLIERRHYFMGLGRQTLRTPMREIAVLICGIMEMGRGERKLMFVFKVSLNC